MPSKSIYLGYDVERNDSKSVRGRCAERTLESICMVRLVTVISFVKYFEKEKEILNFVGKNNMLKILVLLQK